MKKHKKTLTPLVAVLALLASYGSSADCNPNIINTKPDVIYTDHGDGTVTDNETGLMWMKCPLGQSGSTCKAGSAVRYHWKKALEAVQAANEGAGINGYTDWRLPNLNELSSLVEIACHGPSINENLFPNTTSAWFWSSSPSVDPQAAMFVSFDDGADSSYIKYDEMGVRLVRKGQ